MGNPKDSNSSNKVIYRTFNNHTSKNYPPHINDDHYTNTQPDSIAEKEKQAVQQQTLYLQEQVQIAIERERAFRKTQQEKKDKHQALKKFKRWQDKLKKFFTELAKNKSKQLAALLKLTKEEIIQITKLLQSIADKIRQAMLAINKQLALIKAFIQRTKKKIFKLKNRRQEAVKSYAKTLDSYFTDSNTPLQFKTRIALTLPEHLRQKKKEEMVDHIELNEQDIKKIIHDFTQKLIKADINYTERDKKLEKEIYTHIKAKILDSIPEHFSFLEKEEYATYNLETSNNEVTQVNTFIDEHIRTQEATHNYKLNQINNDVIDISEEIAKKETDLVLLEEAFRFHEMHKILLEGNEISDYLKEIESMTMTPSFDSTLNEISDYVRDDYTSDSDYDITVNLEDISDLLDTNLLEDTLQELQTELSDLDDDITFDFTTFRP